MGALGKPIPKIDRPFCRGYENANLFWKEAVCDIYDLFLLNRTFAVIRPGFTQTVTLLLQSDFWLGEVTNTSRFDFNLR
jgi:hypothetical protein